MDQPVPPFATERMPVTSLARLTSAVDIAPAVAFRKPESEAMVRLEVKRLVDEAVVEKSVVVVALLVVALSAVKFLRVVEPATRRLPAESIVVVAVPPKYAVPMLEKRVEEAFTSVVLPVMLALPRKSELPTTSKMLPVVEVAVVPSSVTYEVSVG